MASQKFIPTHLEASEVAGRLRQQFEASGAVDATINSIVLGTRVAKFESPIEHLFAATWEMHLVTRGMLHYPYDIILVPQREVIVGDQRYRPDFVIYGRHTDMPNLHYPLYTVAVDMDGHEFHERTKEQVTYRNRRDRQFQAAGWKLFHFSGSEVWRDPVACVDEVWEHCRVELDRIFHDYSLEQLNRPLETA